ncbi:MAG: hypothetical protein K1X83_12725 [Oligoflexia bacterium]|nr:hypothetical protein [Oligoflexia bacterium]
MDVCFGNRHTDPTTSESDQCSVQIFSECSPVDRRAHGLIEQRGAVVGGLVGLVLIVALAVAVVAYLFGTIVPPGMIGVRQINFGPGQGFSNRGLSPGYHWAIPFYSTVHLVPQKLQVLHIDRERQLHPDSLGALEIQTTDGNKVDVDISLIKKVYPRAGTEEGIEHGGPADLIKTVGTSSERWDNHVYKIASLELRRSLGKLSTSDFYNPHMRESAVETAFAAMRPTLAKVGISVEAVLLRRYTYQAEAIDNAIFQKNLQVQEEAYNEARGKFAEATAQLEAVAAEWDAKIQTLKVEGQNQAQILMSEATLYENQKKAEGDLAVARTQADIDKLRAGALAQSEGARVFVAREMAPLLGSLKGGVVGELDPYNLEEWMKKLGMGAPRQ